MAPFLSLSLAAGALGCGSADSTLGVTAAAGITVTTGAEGSPANSGEMGAGGSAIGSGIGGLDQGGAGTGIPGAWCAPAPACNAPPPDPGGEISWNHTASYFVVIAGSANHRGRDLYVNPGEPQWIIGKFAYGLIDKDLKDERVDIYVLRNCGDMWEFLGSTNTTEEKEHPTKEGVEDNGGRIYFQIPPDKELGVGRHRVHLVVRGDLTATDLFIEVVPPGAPMFVSDVDGTLTGTETEEYAALLTGQLPNVHPDATTVFHKLQAKGYRPMYITARPEWLVERTREFVEVYGFPPGIIHTTTSLTGATGPSAVAYKTKELDILAMKGLVPAWAFGNTATDAEAYDNAVVMPLKQRVFYQFDDTVYGGRRIESYTELLAEIDALPSLCE